MTDTNAKIREIQQQIATIQAQLAGLHCQLEELLTIEPAPTPEAAPEPPSPAKPPSEIQIIKQRFAQKFNSPIEEVTVANVRHRLLNEVWDWGAGGLIDATWLKGKKGNEFWQQASRVMDKLDRLAEVEKEKTK